MKKITFLCAMLIAGLGFSQTQVSEVVGDSNAELFGNGIINNAELAPCNYLQPSAGTPSGYSISAGGPFMTADDFDVATDETFTAEDFTVPILLGVGDPLMQADLAVWDDNGGVPGTALFTFPAQVPVSQTVIGSAFGLDIVECVFDLTGLGIAVDGGAIGAKFWISLGLGASVGGGNQFWEVTDTVTGTECAFENGVDGWQPGVVQFGVSRDVVMLLAGDCSPTLGVGDNLSELVDIFPNPASDILQVRVPSTITVESVSLYDILGKNTGATLVNGEINVSQLARGVYILNVNTDSGTLTQKIVKQ